LANEKTPLRDTAPSTPQRANKTADRSTVARRRVIVGVVIAVVVIGGLFLFLSGGNNPVSDALGITSPSPVPEFTFNHKHVTSGFEATVAKVNKEKQQHAAKQITPAVQAAVTQLLQTGYVDPDTWGDAGAIDDLFTGTAKDQVEPNVDTLTLGTAAADTYESFDPSNANRLKVVAMTDGNAAAIRSMATFEFTGKANQSDGNVAKVTVTGTLFFVPEGNDWKIEAFSVQREIKPMQPKSSATTSTASSSESP
jgi:hypothetical protein